MTDRLKPASPLRAWTAPGPGPAGTASSGRSAPVDRFEGTVASGSGRRTSSVVPRGGQLRGPETEAEVGDRVRGPRVDVEPGEILAIHRGMEHEARSRPNVFQALRRQPVPRSANAQLRWAVAQASTRPQERLADPLWLAATDDASAVLVTYARGVLAARAQGLDLGPGLEARIAEAERRVLQAIQRDPATLEDLSTAPFPSVSSAQTEWAVGLLLSTWDPQTHPAVLQDPRARATLDLVAGVLARRTNNETEVEVRSMRRTLEVDGDTRVFAIHTPPGARPRQGWPTVLFFHGSQGGYAPEQSPEYQALNALADSAGFQIVYPVGTPQDRADLLRTGRGMLNWDPVGVGPGEKNDRFVHELLRTLQAAGAMDPREVYAAGHSQGGFYVSNLIAAYPDVFAGAAILGAGAGSVAQRTNFGALARKTPVLMRVGEQDIHRSLALDLGHQLDQAGFGPQLRLQLLPQRGHEVAPEDLQAILGFFGEQPPFEGSKAGELDGRTGDAAGQTQVFVPSINLANPPEGVVAERGALATMKMLAETPMLDLDGDQDRLTADEWRLALYYLELFPAETRAAITELRRFFVAVPPPLDAVLDVGHLPPALSGSTDARAAIAYLIRTPALDLDGYPTIVSRRELESALRVLPQLPHDVRRGLREIAREAGVSVDA